MVDTFLHYTPGTDRLTSLSYLPCFSVSACLLMRLFGVCTPTSLYFCSLTCVLCLFLFFCVKTFHATGTNHCLLFCTKTTHAPESTSSKLVHRLISLFEHLKLDCHSRLRYSRRLVSLLRALRQQSALPTHTRHWRD